ncbi:melanoma inhibitory activity protein 2 [Spea bombifrons]|uniref:melanoma inhibitory activity protein 2 n=1 Tax=Spea bombifrons TaxID=233779 RepID=UPI00234943ED|nr:melanoma inhibitory activity protein 2 [Spea bombifrons]
MAVHKVLALIVLLIAELQSEKILSEKKKCGDPQCESLMIRTLAIRDYQGPDCRYLRFKAGEEINVYYKLSGRRDDLWQGSTGKAYGFFSKDAVKIEEVFLTKEYEVPAQEIDFICLDGGEYVFENEDSVLHKSTEDTEEMDLGGTGHEAIRHQDGIVTGKLEADENSPDKPAWAPSGIASWFGLGQKHEKEAKEVGEEQLQEDAVRATEMEEVKKENEFKDSDEVQVEKSGWFGGRIRKFLPFGEKEAAADPTPKDGDSVQSSDTLEDVHSDPENDLRDIDMGAEEPETKAREPDDSQAKWFSFGMKNVLGFANKNEAKKQEDLQDADEASKDNSAENPLNPSQDDSSTLGVSSGAGDGPSGGEVHEDLTSHHIELNQDQLLEDIPVREKSESPPDDPEPSPGYTDLASQETEAQTLRSSPETPNMLPDENKSQPPSDKSEHTEPKSSSGNMDSIQQRRKLEVNEDPSSESSLRWLTGIIHFWETTYSTFLVAYSSYVSPALQAVKMFLNKVASTLPEDLQPGPDFYGCPWEVVIFTTLLGFFTTLMFTCRAVRSIKSRCYSKREHNLSDKIVEALKEKSEVLEKLSIVQKQYEEVQESLQDSDQQKLLTEISDNTALSEELQNSNSAMEEKIDKLQQELEDEKKLGCELHDALAGLNDRIRALEDNFKKEKSQKEETRTTLKVFEINQKRLETSFQDSVEERLRLEESVKQLSREAEGWEERFSELYENSKMLTSSVDGMQEELSSKHGQIKSLIDNLLNMKDWSSEVDDASETDDNSFAFMKWDFENGETLDDPQKRTIKKLIIAAKLNASLKSFESEKNQVYENLSDEVKIKEQLTECIKNLQNTKQTLDSENKHLESEVELLKQRISVMSEMYQENETKLHRKLTVQENERIQKQEKLSKVDEKINLATEELNNVKTRVKQLEEEIEKTVSSYQSQVSSYEKKSHDNWLISRAAERNLSDLKKETAHLRQKLTEAEYKMELLEKDPFALDVIHTIGRAYADVYINHQESSPYGPSYLGRHPENRTFLSPPTLLDGPLRISPMLPGGERAMRSPGYYPAYPGAKEQRDMNADRRSDHHRTLSDSGSLSPTWEVENKPGGPPSEPFFPPRRPERFYHYPPPPPSGRFSGPAELTRNPGRPFTDSADGRSSPEHKSSRNGSEENDQNLPSQPPAKEGEAREGPPVGYTPPPQMRVPLLPMDPRVPYFRRPFPMPPPPVEMYGPPGYPGMPPVHATMGPPMPPQHYPAPFPMHREPFFPPPHLRPLSRNDLPPANPTPPPPPAGESRTDSTPEPKP